MADCYTRREAMKIGMGAMGAVAFLGLAGCGGSKPEDVAGQTGSAVDVLYDWTYNGPPGMVAKYWREVRTRMEEAGAGGSIGQLSEVSFEALYQNVPAAIQAKSGPSLATYYADYATYRLAQAGEVASLDSLVGAENVKHWLMASTQYDGSYHGAPHVLEIAVLGINRKHFDKAGISIDDRFESYEQFIEACDRLNSIGVTPIETGTSDGVGAEKVMQFEQLQVCQNPADLLRGVVGDLSVDDPVFARPRDQIPVLRDKYMNPSPGDDTDQMAADKFLNGKAGMAFLYSSQILAGEVGPEFEVVRFPVSDAKYSRPAIGTGDPLILFDYAEDKESAANVLNFLHEPEQLGLWWSLNGSFPADDRFDSSVLTSQAKRVWGMVTERSDDIYALWWPDNFYPPSVALPLIGVIQELFSKASTPSQARDKTEQLFEQFQSGNPAEVEVVKEYIKTLDALVA
jgi:ABC-type glycerol-3-phosphate transport system substrate-binding protein